MPRASGESDAGARACLHGVWGLKALCSQRSSGWKSIKSNRADVYQCRKRVVQKQIFGGEEKIRGGLGMPRRQQALSCRSRDLPGGGLRTAQGVRR